jgi:hypothetical protein
VNDLARILFAVVMGASMTASLLVVPTFARGARGPVVPGLTAVGLLAWLAVAVGAAANGAHHPAVAPGLALALAALWIAVPALRRAWEGAPMAALVGLQALRLVGGARVLAVYGGWLPERYGALFGAADVVLGASAAVLGWAWSTGAPWARRATLGWAIAGAGATLVGLAVQAQLVRPTPGFEALWSAFLTPLLLALLAVAGYRARAAAPAR